MRYVINDDDVEDWYSMLYALNMKYNDDKIEYVLSEMENEFTQNVDEEHFPKWIEIVRSKYLSK